MCDSRAVHTEGEQNKCELVRETVKEKEEGPAGAGFLEMNLSPLFNSVILKLYCASESTGGFVKTQIVGLPPQIF